jgi:hypothetical protein
VPSADAGQLFGVAGSVDVDAVGAQTFTWAGGEVVGHAGWTAELLGPTPALADADNRVVADSTCLLETDPGTEPRPEDRVVCLVTDGGSIVDDGGGLARVPATQRRVVVLAIANGSVVAQWPVDRGDGIALLPGLVVLASTSAPGGTVTAHVLLTGE